MFTSAYLRGHPPGRGRWHAPSSRHLRAWLSVCGRCSFGVLFLSCVCVSVGGVALAVCVCVCDLLIFLHLSICLSIYLYVFSTWRPNPRLRRKNAHVPGRCIHIHIRINMCSFTSAYLSICLSIDMYSHLASQSPSATYECTSHGSTVRNARR